MEESKRRKAVKQLKVNSEILKSSKLTIEQLQSYLNHLGSVFGKRCRYIIPDEINYLPTIIWIANLSEQLRKLEHCNGFTKHIDKYTRKQVNSSYFVTVVASDLICNGIEDLVLEPSVPDTRKNPDILVTYKGKEVYIECKTIETKRFDFTEEHNKMLSILEKYIDVPHQIDIQYKKHLAETDIHRLGAGIQERLRNVKGNGKIIDNDEIQVGVQLRDGYLNNKGINLILWGISTDIQDNCNYPMHNYGRNGRTISISGPKVDYSKILKAKIRSSKRQSPDKKPYVLLIDGNSMLGSTVENVRALSSTFQPQSNTRFSAAIIVLYHPRFDKLGLDIEYHFVSNPFAQFPVNTEFARIFLSARR